MHLLIISHSYPGHFERLKAELDTRGYIDITTKEEVRYPATWRELKLWDVLIPEGCKDDFLHDIDSFQPCEEYLSAHTKGVDRLLRVIRRALRLFGVKSVAGPISNPGGYPDRVVDGAPAWVWLFPLGDLGELRGDHGEEQF